MNPKNLRFAWLAAPLGVLLLCSCRHGAAKADPPDPEYSARCEIAPANQAVGYLTNNGRDYYRTDGPISFTFSAPKSSPVTVQVLSYVLVAPGQTQVIGRTRSPFQIPAGAVCHLGVEPYVKKAPR